jgi:hypothetical protein
MAVYLDDGPGTGNMVVIGSSLRERLLCVVHVERGQRDRIISARTATAAERTVYGSGGWRWVQQPNVAASRRRSPFEYWDAVFTLGEGCISRSELFVRR